MKHDEKNEFGCLDVQHQFQRDHMIKCHFGLYCSFPNQIFVENVVVNCFLTK